MARAPRRKVIRGAALYKAHDGNIYVATKWRERKDAEGQPVITVIQKHEVTKTFLLLHHRMIAEEIDKQREIAAIKTEEAAKENLLAIKAEKAGQVMYDIIRPDGKVHATYPAGHDSLTEAQAIPGYEIRPSETKVAGRIGIGT